MLDLREEAKAIAHILTNGGDLEGDPSYEVAKKTEDGPHDITIWYADCDAVTVHPTDGETDESLARAIVRSGHVINALLAEIARLEPPAKKPRGHGFIELKLFNGREMLFGIKHIEALGGFNNGTGVIVAGEEYRCKESPAEILAKIADARSEQ